MAATHAGFWGWWFAAGVLSVDLVDNSVVPERSTEHTDDNSYVAKDAYQFYKRLISCSSSREQLELEFQLSRRRKLQTSDERGRCRSRLMFVRNMRGRHPHCCVLIMRDMSSDHRLV